MDLGYRHADLRRIKTDASFDGGYAREAVRGYRKVLQLVAAAKDERDLRALRSLNFERLEGDRKHQYSMRLNKQWRVIFELHGEAPNKTVWIYDIEDYH